IRTAGLVLLFVLAGLAAVVRFAPVAPQGRVALESSLDGVKVGRFGQLEVVGLSGDIWRDLRIEKLRLRDAEGIWMEANNVHVTWNYVGLLRRRFEAESIEIDTLKLI